ncbi:hypothetical protein N0V93_003494 [Gnomoniopsis smithogilvyi]|uniref:Uncharacterized protein n=1 Tax=Gnomoniopsis smithogilvyi TaxID=1191159 RepID=A0A9W8YX76_9PEZI|nr:hypothetical protein N0V93_003494 [Gnomoniopsis smithogilvyi]
MDWDLASSMPPQHQILLGCSLEAERADRVAQGLDGLRNALNQHYHGHMVGVIEEIRQSSKLLRDLAARNGHYSRTSTVATHLKVVLLDMSKTLQDITSYYQDKTISREDRWKKMYHELLKEAGGLPLPHRFLLYNNFLALLIPLLTRDPRFDPNRFDQLRNKLLDLRRKQDIPEPAPDPVPATIPATTPAAVVVTTPVPADQLVQRPPAGAVVKPAGPITPISHWCLRVFSRPLSFHTDMGLDERMEITAPLVSGLDPYRPKGKVLMRRSFDNDRFCVKFIEIGNGEPFVVLRMYKNGGSLVTWQPHSMLLAHRESNAVALRRWSESSNGWKEWARLAFVHWEELVLFYTAFVVLKARNPLAAGMNATEYSLADEKTLFQASIVDDGYKHTLMVNQDRRNRGVRLLTAAWSGQLRECPIWTAFVPICLLQSRHWLVRESSHLVFVRGIHLYVFCQKYREAKSRRNGSGPFEIYFTNEQGAEEFVELLRAFQGTIEPPAEQECIAGPSYSQ